MSQIQPIQPKIPITQCFTQWVGYCTDIYVEIAKVKKLKRVVLLNATVLPRKPMIIATAPTTLENVEQLLKLAEEVKSFIGHESTAKLLSQVLKMPIEFNRGEYIPERGDIAIVVKLKRRLEKPEDIKSVKIEDLEFHIINYDIDRVVIQE
jgi:hypothetical protein